MIHIFLLLAAMPARSMHIHGTYNYQEPSQRLNLQNVKSSAVGESSEPEAFGVKTARAVFMKPRRMGSSDLARIMKNEMEIMQDFFGPAMDRPIRDMVDTLMHSTPEEIMHGILDPIMNSPRSQETLGDLEQQFAEFITNQLSDDLVDTVENELGGNTITSLINFASGALPRITAFQFALQLMFQFQVQFASMMNSATTFGELIEPLTKMFGQIPDATPSEAAQMLAEPIVSVDDTITGFINGLQTSPTGATRSVNGEDSNSKSSSDDTDREQADFARIDDASQNASPQNPNINGRTFPDQLTGQFQAGIQGGFQGRTSPQGVTSQQSSDGGRGRLQGRTGQQSDQGLSGFQEQNGQQGRSGQQISNQGPNRLQGSAGQQSTSQLGRHRNDGSSFAELQHQGFDIPDPFAETSQIVRNPGFQQHGGSPRNPGFQQHGGSPRNPGFQQHGGAPRNPGFQQPGGSSNPGFQQPGGSPNPGFQQPGGTSNPGFQQPEGSSNPGFQQPGQSSGFQQPGLSSGFQQPGLFSGFQQPGVSRGSSSQTAEQYVYTEPERRFDIGSSGNPGFQHPERLSGNNPGFQHPGQSSGNPVFQQPGQSSGNNANRIGSFNPGSSQPSETNTGFQQSMLNPIMQTLGNMPRIG